MQAPIKFPFPKREHEFFVTYIILNEKQWWRGDLDNNLIG